MPTAFIVTAAETEPPPREVSQRNIPTLQTSTIYDLPSYTKPPQQPRHRSERNVQSLDAQQHVQIVSR